MSTKQTYVVWAPADPKPEVLERRTTARPEHMKNLARLTSEGILSTSFCGTNTKYSLLNDSDPQS